MRVVGVIDDIRRRPVGLRFHGRERGRVLQGQVAQAGEVHVVDGVGAETGGVRGGGEGGVVGGRGEGVVGEGWGGGGGGLRGGGAGALGQSVVRVGVFGVFVLGAGPRHPLGVGVGGEGGEAAV